MVLLRSAILPLKAVLMNVLSVGAAYGATVAVFQWGWLGFLGLQRTPYIDTITPPLVLAVAFGLSMDYEVFLLTRIRERYLAVGDNRTAVAQGLSTSARTITSAALIMVAVFLAFASAGLPSVQRLGFACAVAIALDATIVRLVLVPAAMELLGKWNWWLPSALARALPSVSLEHCPSAVIPATGVASRRSRAKERRAVAHAQ
jgi:RND superfamily putative drug exporter